MGLLRREYTGEDEGNKSHSTIRHANFCANATSIASAHQALEVRDNEVGVMAMEVVVIVVAMEMMMAMVVVMVVIVMEIEEMRVGKA